MKIFFLLFLVSFLTFSSYAQNLDSPVDYLSAIENAQQEMNQNYMSYISAVAHSGNAKKVEKMREKTLESVLNCKYKISDLPLYKGDNSLRQSSMSYVDLCYKVFNDDYAHIVNMEEIAEQSFDEMEAYILMQEKTNQKLKEANVTIDSAIKTFANKYNVKLIDAKDELSEKMEKSGKVNHYTHQLYLLFFKCNWQDEQLVNAVESKNLNNIEQARNALLAYANEGLAALDSLQAFEGDRNLSTACKFALNDYKSIAEKDAPKLTDFLLKEANFDKIKKAFEAKKEKDRTRQDVDAYNKGVNDLNAAVNIYNQTNEKSNNSRKEATERWNEAQKTFLDAHMPYYN
ncbi:hypothetical protein FRZ67_13020 [Panacibacter ginsenosidivorans]|uniref:DUF3829 domain-containing protein n=1 Tax=Panacibacter ginsenosidivorans TaxID=1813871 RepID=A0A5B8VBW6_9BACT|nr:hypothetical protein [Panacibacter ginsenosidivorans]QEC68176.1 hypothetical protein FRZ67_13020 [Panacibacter ginsenosidivorans]